MQLRPRNGAVEFHCCSLGTPFNHVAVQQKLGSHQHHASTTEGETISETTSTELVVPGLGTLVDLTSVESCAIALNDIRDYERQYRYIKQELTEALVKASEVEGTKTLHFPGGKATVKTGEEWVYDAEEIELGLRAAGMPEHRIRQIVKETVQYKVDAVQAKQAQSANPEYDKVIGDNKTLEQKQPSVSISRLTTSS